MPEDSDARASTSAPGTTLGRSLPATPAGRTVLFSRSLLTALGPVVAEVCCVRLTLSVYGPGVSLFSPVQGARAPGPAPAARAPLWLRVVYGAAAAAVLVSLAAIEIDRPGGVDDSAARLFLGLVPAAAAPLVLHRHRVAVTRNLRSVVEGTTIVVAVGVVSYAVAAAIDAGDPFDGAGSAALLLGISMLVWFAAVPRAADWLDDWFGHRFVRASELPGRFVLAFGRWLLTVEVLLAAVLAVDSALADMAVPIGTLRAWTALVAAVAVAMLARWALKHYSRTR